MQLDSRLDALEEKLSEPKYIAIETIKKWNKKWTEHKWMVRQSFQ